MEITTALKEGTTGILGRPPRRPNKATHVVTLQSTEVHGATVTLRADGYGHEDLYWAKITGAESGDRVWFRWADGGQTRDYHVCRREVSSGRDARTKAVNGVNGRELCECGRHRGVIKCDTWYP